MTKPRKRGGFVLSDLETDTALEDRGYYTRCRIWRWSKRDGYASVRHGRSHVFVHRLTYEEKNGPVPFGLEIDHLCRQRDCVNPDHLEAVTSLENKHRGNLTKLTADNVRFIRVAKGQISSGKLAQRFDVTRATITHIWVNRNWKATV